MTREQLREVLDSAVGETPHVDLAETAWTRGVGMRRRRRAARAGGGTLLAAAAVTGILVISGGLGPGEDVAPAAPTHTPEGSTEDEPSGQEPTGGRGTTGDPATWRLINPDDVTVESQSIQVGVTRVDCSGGVTGNVMRPVITFEADQILIRTDVEPLPDGEYSCPGNDQVEIQVDLGAPIGQRHLVDATCAVSQAMFGVCEGMFRWTYPLTAEPEPLSTDPYLIASGPQDLVDWGSHVVVGEVVAEREAQPRYPEALLTGEVAREVDLRVWEVIWSHPQAVAPVSAGEVVTLEVSPGWVDDRPVVGTGETRLEVGHAYTLALTDHLHEGEQYLGHLVGSIAEAPDLDEVWVVADDVQGVTPDPQRAPRPGEDWDARFVRVMGQ